MNAGIVDDVARAAGAAGASAGAGAGARTVTMAEVAIMDQLVAGFSPQRQLALGRQMLENEQVITSRAVRGPLAAIRSGLEGVDSQDVRITSVLANVRRSIDEQIANIDGAGAPVITPTGLEHHADYGVVGAIRDNLRMLAGFGAI